MYKITLRERAAKEYPEAVIWYKERSSLAAENFVRTVNEAFSEVEAEPEYYRNSYKHFHELKLHKYPRTIVYFIENTRNIVVITTLFHNKRNPDKKFRR